MTPGTVVRLPFESRVLWPDIGTRRGTVAFVDGGWVVVDFGPMTVRLPTGDVVPEDSP